MLTIQKTFENAVNETAVMDKQMNVTVEQRTAQGKANTSGCRNDLLVMVITGSWAFGKTQPILSFKLFNFVVGKL